MTEPATGQQANIDKQLADSQKKVEQRNAAQQTSTGEAKPTPTQEENDRAALGEHVVEKEPDGSVPPEPPPVDPPPPEGSMDPQSTRRRALGAQAPAAPGGDYQTRGTRPASGSPEPKKD